jgi:hypothetical protein
MLRGMWKLQQGEAMLITVGDGKINYVKSSQSKADALEAVGLPE